MFLGIKVEFVYLNSFGGTLYFIIENKHWYHINFLFMNSEINITQKKHNNSLASTVVLISTETWRRNSVDNAAE